MANLNPKPEIKLQRMFRRLKRFEVQAEAGTVNTTDYFNWLAKCLAEERRLYPYTELPF